MDFERFAVILPGIKAKAATAWANDLVSTFASLSLSSPGKAPVLSASAGLAGIASSVEWTMKQAELALIMARAGGGNRAKLGEGPLPSGAPAFAGQEGLPNEWLGVQSLRR